MVHKNVDEYFYVDYEPVGSKSGATYKEIKEYIKEKYNTNVTTLYIAQVKDKCGLAKERNANDENRKHRQPQVTPEKEEMIREAFKYFNLI